MRRSLPQLITWSLPLAAPIVAFAVLRARPGLDHAVQVPEQHFYIVSVVAIMSATLALVAAIAALRIENVRVLLLSLAFLSMAGVFAVHGLATPGYILDSGSHGHAEPGYSDHSEATAGYAGEAGYDGGSGGYGGSEYEAEYYESEYGYVVGFSARLSVLIATAFLAASAIDMPGFIRRRVLRWRALVLGGWLGLLTVFGVLSLRYPEVIPPRVANEALFLRGTLVATLAFGSFAAWRYFHGYLLSRLPMYAAMAAGSAFIVEAQISMHYGPVWRYSWWLYHVLLAAGFVIMLWGLLTEYARGSNAVLTMRDLTLSDPISKIRAGYTELIDGMAAAIEARDGYTLGHGVRVSTLALLMAERMNVPSSRLRSLAHGALLHDLGKIGVPDRVLHKPGKLTSEEYEIVKHHSTRGESILATAGMGDLELAIVRHHHERFDGKGYPDALAGASIPLEARIVAVADVYDSLRSDRAYRRAWECGPALDLIQRESGGMFDPDCVAAFLAVVERWEERVASDAARVIPFEHHTHEPHQHIA